MPAGPPRSGLRCSTEVYGSKREKNGSPRIPTGISFCSYRKSSKICGRFTGECNLGIPGKCNLGILEHLGKPPGVMGECNLGILYSSSLLLSYMGPCFKKCQCHIEVVVAELVVTKAVFELILLVEFGSLVYYFWSTSTVTRSTTTIFVLQIPESRFRAAASQSRV